MLKVCLVICKIASDHSDEWQMYVQWTGAALLLLEHFEKWFRSICSFEMIPFGIVRYSSSCKCGVRLFWLEALQIQLLSVISVLLVMWNPWRYSNSLLQKFHLKSGSLVWLFCAVAIMFALNTHSLPKQRITFSNNGLWFYYTILHVWMLTPPWMKGFDVGLALQNTCLFHTNGGMVSPVISVSH